MSSKRHTVVVDLTVTDSDDGAEKCGIHCSYKAEVDSCTKQIARLQAQVTGLQNEVLDLKAELEHTGVDLKYTREKLKQVSGKQVIFNNFTVRQKCLTVVATSILRLPGFQKG